MEVIEALQSALDENPQWKKKSQIPAKQLASILISKVPISLLQDQVFDYQHMQIAFQMKSFFQSMIEMFDLACTTSGKTLQTLSINELKTYVDKTTSFIQILLRKEDLVKFIDLNNKPQQSAKEMTSSLESSTTQKGKKRKTEDTSMSITTAPIQVEPVAVDFSEDSESSEDAIDTMLRSIQPTQSTSGINGCNITLRNHEGAYSWKSEEWITAEKYIELKVWNNPGTLPQKKQMDWWKEAAFSAKTLVITRHTSLKTQQKIENLLKELQRVLLKEANQFPGVCSNLRPN